MPELIALAGGALVDIVKGWFSGYQAKRQNQMDIEKAIAENKIRLAQSEQSHNEAWEMAALQGGDKMLRRASFVAWSAPLVWAAYDPAGAAAYFRDALGALPEWYVAGYLAISGAVWGIAELKAAGVLKGAK